MKIFDLWERDTCWCSFGRTALYLSLMTIEAKGKEVLCPAFTCATNVPTAIQMAGGIPVFVDVHAEDISLDIEDLQKK